jgi:hypothetical protein
MHGRLFFARAPEPAAAKAQKPKPEKKPRAKNDPKLVAAARELRDRWLERVNAPGGATSLPSSGKYEVTKALAGPSVEVVATIPALPAPIAA